MKQRYYNTKGQVLLIVLLAMAALSTVMLSVASRSINEVGVTNREDESLRAFSAAEAGVEEGLVTGTQQDIITGALDTITKDLDVPAGTGTSTVSTYTADIERYPENARQFAYPFKLLSGQAASVWFVTKDGDSFLPCSPASNCFQGSALTICWGDPTISTETPAIFASVIYNNSGVFGKASIGFDPDSSRRQSGTGGAPANNYLAPTGGSCTIAGQSYRYRANINLRAGGLNIVGTPILMRVSTLYNETTPQVFGVSTSSDLPIQGRKVTSEGSAGEVTRKIDAFLLNPEMPFVFDAAVYSPGNLAK